VFVLSCKSKAKRARSEEREDIWGFKYDEQVWGAEDSKLASYKTPVVSYQRLSNCLGRVSNHVER